jgi:AcrR family transcriptional regulator
MPMQKRSQETNLAIVDAAEQVLVQVGYARASTNAIARRAGVSVGSLYQYFEDKEAVFRAVVRRHRDEMMPLIRSALSAMADPGKDTVEVTLDLMRQMAQVNARNPKLMVAIESELGWIEHETDDSQLLIGQVSEILSKRSKLPSEELPVTAQLMVVTVAYLSRWLVHGKPPELDTERFIVASGRMLHALLLEPKSGSLVRHSHASRSRH